jgi:hypothetical protein
MVSLKKKKKQNKLNRDLEVQVLTEWILIFIYLQRIHQTNIENKTKELLRDHESFSGVFFITASIIMVSSSFCSLIKVHSQRITAYIQRRENSASKRLINPGLKVEEETKRDLTENRL